MELARNELDEIYQQEEMLKGNLSQMCLANNYETLDLNWMLAKDRIDVVYKMLHEHLSADHDADFAS